MSRSCRYDSVTLALGDVALLCRRTSFPVPTIRPWPCADWKTFGGIVLVYYVAVGLVFSGKLSTATGPPELKKKKGKKKKKREKK